MYYGNELLSVDVTDVTNHGWKKRVVCSSVDTLFAVC